MSATDAIYAFADGLAASAAAVPADAEPVQLETWVTFVLGAETFALSVTAVSEIVRIGTITRVPDAPPAVRGIVNLRGRVIPVVDLRVRLGLAAGDPGPAARVLVGSLRGRVIGLLVDGVGEVVRLDPRTLEPPPPDVMTARTEYIRAVQQRGPALLILLDAEQVLMLPADAALPTPERN